MRNGIKVVAVTSRQYGFTIVELAVVIAVIGILFTIGVVSMTAVQKNSRDSERQSDMTIVSEALEKYQSKNGEYPACNQLQGDPATVAALLGGIPQGALIAPGADKSTTSIVCSEPTTPNTAVYIYIGDNSSECQANVACESWHLRYSKESGNDVIEIASRGLIDVADGTPTPTPTPGAKYTTSELIQICSSSSNAPAGYNLIIASSGVSIVNGTPGDDIIYSLSGADTVYGHDGDDIICGSSGSDNLYGGNGNDLIYGASGIDDLYGDSGNDFLVGGSGSDRLNGGAGDDISVGGSGGDRHDGGDGHDQGHDVNGSTTYISVEEVLTAEP